ncbi:hypothetical protein GGX14DRAFT_571873 [Mycena pura]|uniref:Uncharacterized protein n=1 Tax=Mycena pura TaxID=153505 RepID=A0AAD6Y5V4_9AGAR|nr:hypothetical protein GGX14DRAFT_571873 [Mycena pura]
MPDSLIPEPSYWVSARVCDPPYHPAGDENAGLDGVPRILIVVYDGAQPGLYTNRAFALRSAQHAQPLNEVVHDKAAAYRTWHANCFLQHTGEFHHIHGLQTHEQPMEHHVLYGAPISEEELDVDRPVPSPVIAATSLRRYVPHPDTPDHGHVHGHDHGHDDHGHGLNVLRYARGEAPHLDDAPAFLSGVAAVEYVVAVEYDRTLPTPVSPVRCNGRTHIVRDWTPSRCADLLALQQRLEEQLQAPPSSPASG